MQEGVVMETSLDRLPVRRGKVRDIYDLGIWRALGNISFQDNLLAPPVYTRPADFKGMKVPEILLSGDTRKIEEWRYDQSVRRTQERRPDLLEGEL